jgi:3-dehydroquinate synthetase
VLGYLKELRLNYYVDESYDAGNIVRQMMKDKKSSASMLNLVLIEREGVPYRNRSGMAYYEAAPALTEKILGTFLKEYSFQVSDLPSFLEQEAL